MRTLLTILVLLLACGLARAQNANPLTPEQRELAKKTYVEGVRKYNLGKFEEAAKDFEKVYEITGEATFLFNIAQSYRGAKNHERALFFYKSYLRSEPPNHAEIEKRVLEEQELWNKQKKEQDALAAQREADRRAAEKAAADRAAAEKAAAELELRKTRPVENPPAQPPPPPKPPSPALKYAGIALLAVGVAALATGGAMSGLAGSASNDVEKAATQSNGMSMFTSALHDKERDGRLYDTVGIAMYAVGGAAVVAGAALLVVGLRKPAASHARIAPSFGVGHAGLVVQGAF